MTFFPILERELRTAARKPLLFWLRGVGALLGVWASATLFVAQPVATGAGSSGRMAFAGLVGVAFCFACGACLLTADALSAERRQGTLGLLFLTRVRAPDVLLGKLGAAGLAGFGALLAFLPVLMIPVLSGGVTGGEALRKGLALLDTLFVALTAGLWASARGQHWPTTTRKAVLLLLGLLFLPLAYGSLTRAFPPWSRLAEAFSPLTTLAAASDLKYRARPGDYWTSLVVLHLTGWALLGRAGVLLRQSFPEPPPRAGFGEPSSALSENPTVRRRNRRAIADTEPLSWRMGRERGLRPAVWAGVLFVMAANFSSPWVYQWAGGSNLLLVVWWPLAAELSGFALLAWVASRFFLEARRSGELELLAVTPAGAEGLVAAQWARLRQLLAAPLTTLVLFCLLAASRLFTLGPGLAWPTTYAVSLGVRCVQLWVEVLALGWVGMWFGLKARNPMTAIAYTVGLVVLLPTALLQCAHWVIWVMKALGQGGSRYFLAVLISWAPLLLQVLFHLWLIQGARRALGRGLRDSEWLPAGTVLGGLRDRWHAAVRAVDRARHWTPA